jgi:hypothetical protein
MLLSDAAQYKACRFLVVALQQLDPAIVAIFYRNSGAQATPSRGVSSAIYAWLLVCDDGQAHYIESAIISMGA